MQVSGGTPRFSSDRRIEYLTPGFAVNVHGVHASVNTPQCRGADFISVVIMGAATTRNARTQITCLIHSYPFLSFSFSFFLSFYSHACIRTFTHNSHTSIQALMCLLGQCILITFFCHWSVVYNSRISLWIPRSSFARINLHIVCLLYIYRRHEIRYSSHISTFLCIHRPPTIPTPFFLTEEVSVCIRNLR